MPKDRVFVVLAGIALLTTLSVATAWTGPSGSPPNNNVAAPVNVGSAFQDKSGSAWFDGGIGINAGSNFCIGNSCISSIGGFSQWASNGTSIYYNGGNVGIGISNPGYALDVNGVARTSSYVLTPHINSAANLLLDTSNNNGTINVGNNWLNVMGNSSGLAGYVGIGTTNPAYKLEVSGDSLTDGWLRTAGNTGWYSNTWGSGLYMSDSYWIRGFNSNSGLWMNAGNIGTNGGLTVGYGGASVGAGGGIFSGSVGIGTQSPSQKLDVSGNVNASGYCASGTCGITGSYTIPYGASTNASPNCNQGWGQTVTPYTGYTETIYGGIITAMTATTFYTCAATPNPNNPPGGTG